MTDPISLPLLSRLAQQEPATASSNELLEGLEAWQRVSGFVISRMWLQVAELHARFTGSAREQLEVAQASGDRSAAEDAADQLDLAERSVCAEIGAVLGWSTARTQGQLEAVMSVLDGVRVQAALDHAAFGIKVAQAATGSDDAPADQRNLDQIRCDLLADTLIALGQAAPGDFQPTAGTGTAGTGPRVKRGLREEVVLTVPFETITGDADERGYLARYGPVSAHTARLMAWEVARDGYWRCAVTDDDHGTLLGLGRSTFAPNYRAPEYLQRFANLRDRVCDFPTCRTPAAACDFEHTVPHPEGSTCECGGAKRCRSHHRLKHETPWQ